MSATAPPAARAAEAAPPAAAAAEAAPATSIAAAAARLHAAAASLPAPGAAFLDASVSPEFRRDVQEVRERSVKLLSRLKKVKKWRGKEEREREACRCRPAVAVLNLIPSTSFPNKKNAQASSTSGEPLLGDDPRAARDAVAHVLDPLVERLNREKEASSSSADKAGETSASAAMMHAPSWGSRGGGGPASPVPVSGASSSRPQDAFERRVNNDRGAAFVPPRRGWRACCRVADGGGGEWSGGDGTLFLEEDEEEGGEEGEAANAATAPQCTYHPLERLLSSLETCVQPWQLEPERGGGRARPLSPPPPPLSSTPFAFVDTPAALSRLVSRWLASGVRELAFDLEAHSFHSFQGFTCLIQLSTRAEDAVVDALSPAMRGCAGSLLAPLFADPRVAKVAHGARHDIAWLQRDFGLFVSNLFDTGVAAGLVGRPRGLGALYGEMLGLAADKKWQTADWRVRPLPRAALAYAREDTHWLLHVADRLKQELAAKKGEGSWSGGDGRGSSLLSSAFEASRQLCLSRYDVERFSRRRALALAATVGGLRAPGAAREVFLSLADWRDAKARLLDESTGAVLPKGLMAKIAKRAADSASSPLSFDAAALRSAVGGGGSPCMVSRYSREVVEAAREGLRRWERLRSGELSEAALREGEGDDEGDDDGGGGDGGGGGEERGKGLLSSRPPAASAPKPMLLDPTPPTSVAAANNAVPFKSRDGSSDPAAAAAPATAVVLLPASGCGSLTTATALGGGKGKSSLSASAAAFSPSPMASSFFGSAVAPVRKQQPPPLTFSMPLAFAPAKAPSPPPPPPPPPAAATTAAAAAPAAAAEMAAKGRSASGDDFLPVPLGDLRPGSRRANRGKKQQGEEEEEEEEETAEDEEETRNKRNEKKSTGGGGAPGDGDTEADAAVASILKAGRRAMAVSSSSSSENDSSDGESDSSDSGSDQGSDSDEGPEEVATAAAAAAPRSRLQQQQQQRNNGADAAAAAAAAARRLSSKKRPSPASFDFEAKIAASPGIVSAAEPPPPADGGRGRGRGAAARGRGRGRLGSNRDLLPAGPAPPTASFDPYALPRLGEIKAGKRSGTMPKSGNRSKSFV